MIESLADRVTGTYSVTTASGTEYTINLDEGYSVRHGAVPLRGEAVVEDGERFYYSLLKGCEVGKSMYQESTKNSETHDLWRISTPITKIEEIFNDI